MTPYRYLATPLRSLAEAQDAVRERLCRGLRYELDLYERFDDEALRLTQLVRIGHINKRLEALRK